MSNKRSVLLRSFSILFAFLCCSHAAATDPLLEAGSLLPDSTLVWTAQNFGRLLARSNDEEAVEYGLLLSETAAYLAKTDPGACIKMLAPSKYGPLRANNWPKIFLERQMAIQRKIAQTALKSPSVEPTEEQAGPIVDKVIEQLLKQYGQPHLKAITSLPESPTDRQYCLAWSHYYLLLASLPVKDASLAIRWLNAPP